MLSKGKIVLCGGTGFVGQELGIALVKRGYLVVVLTRDPGRYQGKLAFPCELAKFSHEDLPEVSQAIDGALAVVNLSGAPVDKGTWDHKGTNSVYASRVGTARILMDAIAGTTTTPTALIQASGVGFYGKQSTPCDESAPAGETYLAEVAKDLEKESVKAVSFGMRHVAVRLGVVLGHGSALDEINKLYAAGIGSRFLGAEKFPLPWIHIDDAVGIFIHAIEDTQCAGPVNAVAPHAATLADLHAAMTAEQGIQYTPPVPAWSLRLAMKNRAALLFENSTTIPQYLVNSGFRFKHTNLPDAIGSLYNREARGQYRLVCKQFVDADPEEVWAYFSRPHNLEAITPPWLQFRIKSVSDEDMREGTEINYRLRLKGIPISWKSVISKSVPGVEFVDEQIKGPYSIWKHTHHFEPLAGGILITDDVSWRLPVGKLGALAAGALVQSDVHEIFSYRTDAIARIFNRTGGERERKLLSSAKEKQETTLSQW